MQLHLQSNIGSAYSKQHRISTPTTSNSSPHTASFSPYISHYGNMPSVPSTPSSASITGQQQQESHYGNAYNIPGYGSQTYSNKLDPSSHQPLQHQHHNSQTIVQPRGPTIDASNKYAGLSSTTPVNQHQSNLDSSTNLQLAHTQNQDHRRQHHSSGNSSGGGSDEQQQRISSYANHSPHQYLLQHRNVGPSSSQVSRPQNTNISNTNKIMPPVAGHPYMPQNVPLPPPDVRPQQQQYPVPNVGDLPHSVTSQLPPKTLYQTPQGVYEPHLRQQEQSSYAQNQVISPQHLPTQQKQSDFNTFHNKVSAATPDSGIEHPQISQLKEKSQTGSWKRKHSADSKRIPSDSNHQHKKARLSLEGQKVDKAHNENDDPYVFDDDVEKSSVGSGSNSNSAVEYARFSVNGRQGHSSAGPVYKFKSALLSREQSKSNTPEPVYQTSPHQSAAIGSSAYGDKKAECQNSRTGNVPHNYVALNSKCVPLRFDASDNYFTFSCDDFLNDLLSKPISISRRPSIDNWKSAMAARAEKKADKRKAKELRKELAAEKAAALEKALVEKGSVFSAKVKGAAELRDTEKRLDPNNYSYNNVEDHRIISRGEDKKSQHVTFSSVPPIQYPPPVTSGANIGYSSSTTTPGYAISNVSNLPAMQIPAFQPQPQYYSSNSHTILQTPSVPPATLNTTVTSEPSSVTNSPMISHPSLPNVVQGLTTIPHPPQRPTTMSNKNDEKLCQFTGDKKFIGKSKSSSSTARTSDNIKVNEDQKENRPKKLQGSSNKVVSKAEGSKYKTDKISIPHPSSTKSPQIRPVTSKSPETRRDEQQVVKEREHSRTLQANGNTNTLNSSNDVPTVDKLTKDTDLSNKPKVKKGTLWAMPIVPKLPQKPNEKRKSQSTIATPVIPNSMNAAKKLETLTTGCRSNSENKQNTTNASAKGISNENGEGNAGNGTGALADVWRQAFGAVKPKKPIEVSPLNNKLLIKQEIDAETCKKSTYLDIPPEVRRRPKPTFGGLIHFPPDWERAVKKHHEKCRLPMPLIKGNIYLQYYFFCAKIRLHNKLYGDTQYINRFWASNILCFFFRDKS